VADIPRMHNGNIGYHLHGIRELRICLKEPRRQQT
jgi:hypothetical protein